MGIGERLKQARLRKHLSRQALADILHVGKNTIWRWEAEERTPSDDDKIRLAKTLDVSVAYLLGETDTFQSVIQDLRVRNSSSWIKISILDTSYAASLGFEVQKMDDLIENAKEFIVLPVKWIGRIGEHLPFIIEVSGDSMEDAGILSCSEAVINPEAEVFDGDTALVCFGQKNEWAIKWVYSHSDDSIELRSSSPNYPPRFYSKREIENGWCRIVGKVVRTLQAPKRGI